MVLYLTLFFCVLLLFDKILDLHRNPINVDPNGQISVEVFLAFLFSDGAMVFQPYERCQRFGWIRSPTRTNHSLGQFREYAADWFCL